LNIFSNLRTRLNSSVDSDNDLNNLTRNSRLFDEETTDDSATHYNTDVASVTESQSESKSSVHDSSGASTVIRSDSLIKWKLTERDSQEVKPGLCSEEKSQPNCRGNLNKLYRRHDNDPCISSESFHENQANYTRVLRHVEPKRVTSSYFKFEEDFDSDDSSDMEFDHDSIESFACFERKYPIRMSTFSDPRKSITGQNAVDFVSKTFLKQDSHLRLSLLTPTVLGREITTSFKKEHTSRARQSTRHKQIKARYVLYRHYSISIWRSYLINSKLKLFVRFIGFFLLCLFAAFGMVLIFFDVVGEETEGTVTFVFFCLGVMPFLCFSFIMTNTCIHARLFISEHDRGFNSIIGFLFGQMARTFLDYGVTCLLFNACVFVTMDTPHGWDLYWMMRFWGIQISYTWLIIQVFYCIIILYGGRRDLASGGINIFLAVSMALCGYLVPQPRMMFPVRYVSYLIPLYWYMQSSFVLMFKDQQIHCELESDESQNPLLCVNSIGNVILHALHSNNHNFAGTIIISTTTVFICFYSPYCFYNSESWPRQLLSRLKSIGRKCDI